MSLIDHAKHELSLIHGDAKNSMQDAIEEHILKMLAIFSEAGHSGGSAAYTSNILERLLRFLPLAPLTGEDDEWMDVSGHNSEKAGTTYQNKRCFGVFKTNGEAYFLDGKIFSDDGGETWYTNKDSRVPVTFPFAVPSRPEKVFVTESEPVKTSEVSLCT